MHWVEGKQTQQLPLMLQWARISFVTLKKIHCCQLYWIYHFDFFLLVTYGMEGGWEILGEFGKVLSVQPGSLYSSCRWIIKVGLRIVWYFMCFWSTMWMAVSDLVFEPACHSYFTVDRLPYTPKLRATVGNCLWTISQVCSASSAFCLTSVSEIKNIMFHN